MKCHIKVLLGDFNAKAGREDILKPTVGNERLHEIYNYNGVRESKNSHIKNFDFQVYYNVHTSQHS
jgi:hypothetical protein